jgi:outer membrane protein
MCINFYKTYILICVLSVTLNANALVGIDDLTDSMYKKNQTLAAQFKDIESKQALSGSANSMYYPTLNAVGGYEQNKTDEYLNIQKGYTGYIQGSFNLFRGFKDLSIRQQAEVDTKISMIDLEIQKRQLRSDLVDVLSRLIYLHKLQTILEEEYKTTQTQKKMAEKKVAAGLTGSVDNLEFELRENEIEIEQRQIDQQHQEAHQQLVKIYGEEIPDTALGGIDFSETENLTKAVQQIPANNTLDYQKAQLIQRRSEFAKKELRSDFLPALDLTYQAGRLNPSEQNPIKFDEYRYAVQLTLPLFSGFDTFYKNKSASLVVLSSEKLKRQVENDVQAEIDTLKEKISELNKLFQINEKKLVLLQKYFNLTLSEYKRGIKNSPDLVSATERLFSSKKKKYDILKELELSKVKVEYYK